MKSEHDVPEYWTEKRYAEPVTTTLMLVSWYWWTQLTRDWGSQLEKQGPKLFLMRQVAFGDVYTEGMALPRALMREIQDRIVRHAQHS